MSSNSMFGKGTLGTANIDHRDPTTRANARQVGGAHYSGSAYQHWDYAIDLKMSHLEGAATKYLSRAGNKADVPRYQDLEKCLHYLEKLQEVFKEGRLTPLRTRLQIAEVHNPGAHVARFVACSMGGAAFTARAVAAMVALASWATEEDLNAAHNLVHTEWLEEKAKPRKAPV